MKMISIRKQQREELKKSRATSTAQSLPTIEENADKRNTIRLSERPSSDSLSSFISLGSSEGNFDNFQYFNTSIDSIRNIICKLNDIQINTFAGFHEL